MRQHDRGQAAGPQEQKRRVEAEERRVGELDERAYHGGQEGDVRVGEGELVEVVEVRDAEVERGEEDEVREGRPGEHVQGENQTAEDEFFTQGGLGGGGRQLCFFVFFYSAEGVSLVEL